jgi:trehalose-6-phosphatase
VFNKYEKASRPDFLLVAGNDRSDENVFRWAKQLKDDWTVANVQTVTVGARNSIAMSTLPNGATGKFLHNTYLPSSCANGCHRTSQHTQQAFQDQELIA